MTTELTDPHSAHWVRLRTRARRLSNSVEEAEDLLQETAMRLMQTLRDGTVIDAPDRYAMITLHNLARQGWRQRRETEELEEKMALTPPAAPARLASARPATSDAIGPRRREQPACFGSTNRPAAWHRYVAACPCPRAVARGDGLGCRCFRQRADVAFA